MVNITQPSKRTCEVKTWDGMQRTLCSLGLLGSDLSLLPAEYKLRAFCNPVGSEDKANTVNIGMQDEWKELGAVVL